jgi:hypothetical protein
MGATVIVVPRGLSQDYYRFLELTTRANGDQLVIDRRMAERRHRLPRQRFGERRASDRRRSAPTSWIRDGVIVVADR